MMIFLALIREYSQREYDIDSIIEDFRTALLWSRESEADTIHVDAEDDKNDNTISSLYESHTWIKDIINPISLLNKIIEQESHNLRLPIAAKEQLKESKSIMFAQQLHIRSFGLNSNDIAEKSRKFLSASKMPFLDIFWARVGIKKH